MRKIANFTRHYPRPAEIFYWRSKGYELDSTPRMPSFDETWSEKEITAIIYDELTKIRSHQFEAILIGGLTNVMAYAWYLAQALGLDVLHARGRKGRKGYEITTHSKLLTPSCLEKGGCDARSIR